MIKQKLLDGWKFRQAGTKSWLEATVPGGVHTDLMELDLIEDPFIGDNEKKAMWIAEEDWEYKLTFRPRDGLNQEERITLVAEGLDTVASVYLNNALLGKTENQFRRWTWDIKDLIVSGENVLKIVFSGPASYVAKEQKLRRLNGVSQAIEGGPHLRKAPCQFGWDWGPMLPSIGIWKGICLEGRSKAQLGDVHLRQIHNNGEVSIQVEVAIENWGDSALDTRVKLLNPNGHESGLTQAVIDNKVIYKIPVENPSLWWPNGYGSQDLYQVSIELYHSENLIDERTNDIGLRTIELIQVVDEFGKSFQFVVNGIPIFAKGSNWIPADTFLPRFSSQRLERLIADAAASHQNMLRVWGGGIYEEERFYDLCDKYGILVWQDFIFSCSIYPLDMQDFIENVRIEIEENIKRIRHRASLALWCGNNEMEWGWESWGWQKNSMEDQLPTLIEQFPQLRFLLDMIDERNMLPDWQDLKVAYDSFFHHQLPEWVTRFDPDTAYWPSSPSSDTPFQDANGETRGDAHFWDVWHGRKPFTAYRESFPRFMSEFGFQAFPTMETVEYYTNPEDRNLTSYVMEHHQRGNHGNGLIIAQMTDTFRMPEDFYSWIYLSNILQAEGIRYGVEHWRRNMHRVSGTLYWQLNDCWPVASWSSIDYFGRWKALHYATRRFYAPLLLSIEDKPPKMSVHVTSDLTKDALITIKWSLETLDGLQIKSGSLEEIIQPLDNTHIAEFDFQDEISQENQRELIFICKLWKGNDYISTSIGTFVPNKHLSLEDPDISVSIQENGHDLILSCTAKYLARFVEIKLRGYDVVFSDNYFDIPAGRIVQITLPQPGRLTLDEARNALSIYSLYNSFSK